MRGLGDDGARRLEEAGIELDALHPAELLDLARASLAAFAERDLTELTEAEVLESAQVSTEVAVLATAVQTAAVGRLDVSKPWQPSGARSAGAWLQRLFTGATRTADRRRTPQPIP